MNANYREQLKDKKRIVIKIGSSSLIHTETGEKTGMCGSRTGQTDDYLPEALW